MNWLSAVGLTVMGILILSAAADILFLVLVYKDLIKLFKSTRFIMKALSLLLSLTLCVPFVIALHRFTIFFLMHHIAVVWLVVMVLMCTFLTMGLLRTGKERRGSDDQKPASL